MILIKGKNGIVKGRTCENGSKQNIFFREVEIVASPTISLEGLFTTLVIDVYEGREVDTFDIPGAYLHADMPKDKKYISIKRNIRGNNFLNQSGAQVEHEVQKWAEGLIYVSNMFHMWLHRIVSTVVQIILRNINGEKFQTESI